MKKNRSVCLLLALVLVVGLLPVSAGAAQVEGYLSDIYAGVKMGMPDASTAGLYETTVSSDGHTVTAYVPDSNAMFTLGAKLSSSAPTGSTVSVTYTGTDGKEMKSAISAALLKAGRLMPRQKFISTGTTGNTMTITVVDAKTNNTQTYTVVAERLLTLKTLSITDVALNETFNAATTAYTAATSASQITINAEPYSSAYTVTYNGGAEGRAGGGALQRYAGGGAAGRV